MKTRNYYYDRDKDGKMFITSNNPNKKLLEMIKDWLKDKWRWLLTFNNMPSIIINCDRIIHKTGEDHVIKVEGRLKLTLNGDIVHIKKEEND